MKFVKKNALFIKVAGPWVCRDVAMPFALDLLLSGGLTAAAENKCIYEIPITLGLWGLLRAAESK